ncbi:MAG TPA: glycosyltransferase family 39 protein [Candidatus Saccharimonadia bacterium]|nr:glycosyltransferase family 39 protein [Candidatus Saccharimonadia bacterium]
MKSYSNRTIAKLAHIIQNQQAWIAGGLLAVMAVLGFGSMAGNSAIVDEVAHISAGYSYLHYQDYRLNPEHPPLLKDLAALPLQFTPLKFPLDLPAWKTDVNGQWETGWNFLYHLGNDADKILLLSRLPLLLLALAFGAVLYWIVRRRWGTGTALLALFFYALSPNILAHATLVTTDVGASIFMVIALAAFVWFVERPTKMTFWWLSLAIAGAQLAKFSGILLYAFLGLVSIGLALVLRRPASLGARMRTYVGGLVGASVVSLAWVWLYYIPQVWRMPTAVQDALIQGSFDSRFRALADGLAAINHLPLMKPLVQYLLGVLMVFGRVTGGNVTYFNGQVSNQSFHTYFPELFVLKTQIGLLILMVVLVGLVLWAWRGTPRREWPARWAASIRGHLFEWVLGLFAAFYFGFSTAGNLNLGIRHILPVYVPLFVLVAVGTVKLMRRLAAGRWARQAVAALALLLVWYGGSTVATYPSYLSYFNEFIGGGANAGRYFSDSNVDWGQDLKRLVGYVKAHPEIHHIAVDYFGGGVPQYYFCQRRYDDAGNLVTLADGYDCSRSVFEQWRADYGPYKGQYIAVSETFLENDRFYAQKDHRPGYEYLRVRQPVAQIGNSIYVYKLY